jgi:DNA polymerase
MDELSIDFETRSTVNLKKTGVHVYAAHPLTDIWVMAWAINDEEPQVWHPGEPLPERVVRHIESGGAIRAWNAEFERVIWREIMVKRYGAPQPLLEQWWDTAVEAAAMALPRKLEKAAAVVGVEQQKDTKGRELMMRMTRPRKVLDDGTVIWWEVPERIARLDEYCKQDVRTERAMKPKLRRLVPRERELYLLDQRINDRGVKIDRELVLAGKAIADEGTSRANGELYHLTNGRVAGITKNKDLVRWLNEEGVVTNSVSKPTVAELLGDEIPASARAALELRSEAGKTSLAKIDAMLLGAGDDDRLRGLLLFHGAATGRWAGMRVQPQNFPRGDVPDAERFIPDVLAGDYDIIDLFAPPVGVISSLLRAMLVAGEGRKLMAADFSAIEARVLNWLAGQQDVVDSFRLYDAGDKSRDPYKIMAVRMGRAPTVAEITKADRQAGKAAELGCGYQMGWSKFISAAWDVYQVSVTPEQSKAAVGIYRETHPYVVQLWDDANSAALEAVAAPGTVQRFGANRNLAFTKRGGYLYLVLPNGRPLVYVAPKIVDRKTPWGDIRPAVEFSGEDSYTRQWGRITLYGGLITENVVQAVSRDLMAEAMFRLEAANYPVILTVHDEIVTEPETHHGIVSEMERIMREVPAWGTGCPIAAEGWEGHRYRK